MSLNCEAFPNDLYLGQITKVTPSSCVAHVPNSALLRPFWSCGEEYTGGIVGHYVVIEGQRHGFLAMVQEIELPDKDIRILEQENTKESKDTAYHPNAKLELLLSFDFFSLEIQKGLGRYPIVGSRIYLCEKNLLKTLIKKAASYNSSKNPVFLTDSAVVQSDESVPVVLYPQGIFERHCAILGTTGGGKSYTVAKLIEGILEHQSDQKTVLIDATGEYRSFIGKAGVSHVSFGGASEGSEQIHFSYKCLRVDDFIPLFRPAGQIQRPKLLEAIKSLKIVRNCLESTGLGEKLEGYKSALEIKNETPFVNKVKKDKRNVLELEKHFSSDLNKNDNNYDIRNLARQIGLECVEDKGKSYGEVFQRDIANVSSLVSRVNQTVGDESFDSIFNFTQSSQSKNFVEIYNDFQKAEDKKLLIISMEHVVSDNALRELLVNAIGRHFLNLARAHAYKKKPLLLLLDEAHLFLRKSIKDEYFDEIELDAFDKIAKECRKHGLYLCLSTQMPRDIPDGVLSQMGSFFIHRLINNLDVEKVRYACPEASRQMLSHLPVLGPGEALFVSVSMPMPILLKMHKPMNEPESKSPEMFWKFPPLKKAA